MKKLCVGFKKVTEVNLHLNILTLWCTFIKVCNTAPLHATWQTGEASSIFYLEAEASTPADVLFWMSYPDESLTLQSQASPGDRIFPILVSKHGLMGRG